MGASRYSYNRAVEYLRQPGTVANWKEIKTPLLHALPKWSKSTPFQIKSLAMRDACKAVSKAKLDYLKTGEFNTVHFRTKNDPDQSCYIPKSALKNGGIYPTLSQGRVITGEELPKDDLQDCRLLEKNGCWYLCVPRPVSRESTKNQGRVVALDPGVRTFQTFYSEDSCGKLGVNTLGVILRIAKNIDRMIGTKTKTPTDQRFKRRHIQRAIRRARQRLSNLIDELHWKCANFFTKEFDVILLPHLKTGKLSQRAKRKLRRKSVRQMLTLRHYQFKQRIGYKAEQRRKLVIEANEAYTSKTVSWTGEINHKLGGSKIVKSQDGQRMDRDINGARGIFLRALGDTPILRENLECIGTGVTTPSAVA